MDKSRQVLVKRDLLSEDLQAWGNETELSSSLMAGKQSFVWAYFEGDSHLRGYLHVTVTQTPRNATLAEGR